MCGGRGTRLRAPEEKPLVEIGDKPMVDRVLAALEDSRIDRTYAAVSPHVPDTAAHLDDRSIPRIETPGHGYVEDLEHALDEVDGPILTVATDLPLLEGDAIDCVLDSYQGGSLTVCVPSALKRLLGLSVDLSFDYDGREVAPTGVNVTDSDSDTPVVMYDARFAVNVNREADVRVAEELV